MEKIGSYGTYQSSIYEQRKTAANTSRSAESKNTSQAKNDNKVELSSAAKKLLKELQKTYRDTDFMVANYENEEEAAEYLSRGTSTYSVLMTPDELEKMAADKDYKQENLRKLDDSLAKLQDMKNQLGDRKEEVKRVGMTIGDDGKVSYFAELEKTTDKQRERIEKQRENKKEEAVKNKKEEGAFIREGVKRTTLFANSVKELKDKISQVDWNAIRDDGYSTKGNHFDFTA